MSQIDSFGVAVIQLLDFLQMKTPVLLGTQGFRQRKECNYIYTKFWGLSQINYGILVKVRVLNKGNVPLSFFVNTSISTRYLYFPCLIYLRFLTGIVM